MTDPKSDSPIGRGLSLFLVLFMVFTPGPTWAASPGLQEIYQKTLERSESVEVQRLLVEQAQNNESRAQARMFPTLEAAASSSYQGRDSSGTASTETSSLTRLGFRQPLYRGGALTSAFDLAQIDVRRSLTQEKQVHWQTWWLVTQLYFQVLRGEKALQNYEELERVVGRRQTEIARRVKLGSNRAADLQSTISQRHTVLAQIQSLRTNLKVTRLQLQQLSGLEGLQGLSRPQPPNIESIETGATAGMRETRPDLELKTLNVERAQLEVKSISSNLFPELSLVGNYYPYRNDSFLSSQNSLRWDLGLQFLWSLDFEEMNLSQRKDRELSQRLEEVRRREAVRLSTEEFDRKLEQRKGAQKQIRDFTTALESSRKALQALQADFRQGTASLLDVVAQENSYWDLQRQYDNLVFDVDLMGWELLWLNGQMPEAMAVNSKMEEKE